MPTKFNGMKLDPVRRTALSTGLWTGRLWKEVRQPTERCASWHLSSKGRGCSSSHSSRPREPFYLRRSSCAEAKIERVDSQEE